MRTFPAKRFLPSEGKSSNTSVRGTQTDESEPNPFTIYSVATLQLSSPEEAQKLPTSVFTLYSKKRNLLYCQQGKTGSTSLLQVLMDHVDSNDTCLKTSELRAYKIREAHVRYTAIYGAKYRKDMKNMMVL